MPKVTIIIPVYNSEKYISNCLDSVLMQTFTDFECICINDGSNDTTPKICDAYALRDDRISAIHKDNGGVSSARNVGLRLAQGDYITFLDSDDKLETDALEIMVKALEKSGSDLTFFKVKSYYNGKEVDKKVFNDFICNISDFQNYLPQLLRFQPFVGVCAKLFKRNKIVALYDETIQNGEDTIFNLNYIKHINKIQYCSSHVYTINILQHSLSRRYNIKNMVSSFVLYEEYIKFMKYYNFSESNCNKVELFMLSNLYQMIRLIIHNSKNFNICYSDIDHVLNNEIFISLSKKSPTFLWKIVPTSWILQKKNLLFVFYYFKLRKCTGYILRKLKLLK